VDEVDSYLASCEAEAERIHRQWEAKYPTTELRRLIRQGAAAVTNCLTPRGRPPTGTSWGGKS